MNIETSRDAIAAEFRRLCPLVSGPDWQVTCDTAGAIHLWPATREDEETLRRLPGTATTIGQVAQTLEVAFVVLRSHSPASSVFHQVMPGGDQFVTTMLGQKL